MASSTSDGSERGEKSETKSRAIWPFVVLALIVSVILAGAYLAAHARELPHADGTPFGDGRAIGSWVGASLPIALIAWAIFHFVFFRARAPLARSLVALGFIAVLTPAIVVTALLVMLQGARSDAVAARRVDETNAASIGAITRRLRADLAALGLPQDALEGVHTAADADVALAKIERARTLLANYAAALEAEMRAARARVSEAGLDRDWEQRALQQLEEVYAADSVLRRGLTLQTSVLDSNRNLLTFLRDNADHWSEQGGRYMFEDAAVLSQFNGLAAAHDEVVRQLQALQQEAAGVRAKPN